VVTLLGERLQEANRSMSWAPVRREVAHGRAAAELCRGEPLAGAQVALLRELGTYLSAHGEHASAIGYFDEARSLIGADARRTVDAACLLRMAGIEKQGLDRSEEALSDVRRALELAAGALSADAPDLADFHNDVGYVLKMQGHPAAALPHFRRSLEIIEASSSGTHSSMGMCLNNLGTLHEAQGHLDRALGYLRKALEVDRSAFGEEHPKVAIRLNNIGRVLGKRGDWP